jgi:hypothetical protein
MPCTYDIIAFGGGQCAGAWLSQYLCAGLAVCHHFV